jgi:hypothetical protein
MTDWHGWRGVALVGMLVAACGQGATTVQPIPPVPSSTAVVPASAAANPTPRPSATSAPVVTQAPATSTPDRTAGTGGTGSLAYIRGFNVWFAAPDGSQTRQLTTDGTQGNAYHDPVQTDDGRVFALRGKGTLVQLDRQGQPLAAPVTLRALENGTEGLAAAPDGTRLAYVTTGYGTEIDPRFGTPSGTFLYGGTDVITADGTSVDLAAAANLLFPNWVDAGHLVGADGVDLYTDAVGPGEPERWVSYNDGCLIPLDCPAGKEAAASLSRPALSPNGKVLAYSYRPYFGLAGRRMATVASAPPSPPSTRCAMPGQENYADAGTFAPDGAAFAYDDTNFMPDTFETVVGKGIYAMAVNLDAVDCGLASARLVIPGGSQPAWGPVSP